MEKTKKKKSFPFYTDKLSLEVLILKSAVIQEIYFFTSVLGLWPEHGKKYVSCMTASATKYKFYLKEFPYA